MSETREYKHLKKKLCEYEKLFYMSFRKSISFDHLAIVLVTQKRRIKHYLDRLGNISQ